MNLAPIFSLYGDFMKIQKALEKADALRPNAIDAETKSDGLLNSMKNSPWN